MNLTMRHMMALGSRLHSASLISSQTSRASEICPCDARAEASTLFISLKLFTGTPLSKTTYNHALEL